VFETLDIGRILVQYFCLVFSLCVHEASHAAMANWCGDPSARLMGRLTLDPRKHADIFGTVVFPLVAMFTGLPFIFGWAKPVPFNPVNLHNMRRDPVLIAMAGPASNLAIAIVVTIILRIAVITTGIGVMETPIGMICVFMIIINFVLMLFNLIPVPPLDGHYVLKFFLPAHLEQRFEQIGPFGIIIAVMLAGPLLSGPLRLLMGLVINYTSGGIGGVLSGVAALVT